jgi:hypothetical protein
MPEHTSSVVEAQVDYLTCSAHSDDGARRLSTFADDLLTGAEAAGNKRVGWRSMGYLGYHAGSYDWGRRDERQAILRISGHPAADLLTKAMSCADYVSRLDVAVTWRAVPPDPHLGANAYSLAEAWYSSHSRAAVPSHTADALGGYTCYLGDRRSPYYGRIYNKEAERLSRQDPDLAEHYAGCWRYEVEAHDSRAVALAEAICAAGERPAWVQQWLHDFYADRGIPPMFPPTGAQALLPGFHRRTDDESSLRHLARNVRPTLTRLRSHGREDDVRTALGMNPGEDALRQLRLLLMR